MLLLYGVSEFIHKSGYSPVENVFHTDYLMFVLNINRCPFKLQSVCLGGTLPVPRAEESSRKTRTETGWNSLDGKNSFEAPPDAQYVTVMFHQHQCRQLLFETKFQTVDSGMFYFCSAIECWRFWCIFFFLLIIPYMKKPLFVNWGKLYIYWQVLRSRAVTNTALTLAHDKTSLCKLT